MFPSGIEAVMPDSGSANQVGVLAERSQCDLGPLEGHEPAALANRLVNSLQEKVGAFYDAAAEHDGVRRKHGYYIGEAKAEVTRFALDCPKCKVIAFSR